jgi:hypothetical protein
VRSCFLGLGGCSQASAAAAELTGAPVAVPASRFSLAPQAQDMPGAPIPAAPAKMTPAPADPAAGVPAPAATAVAPAVPKATTTKASTKAATTKAAAPKTTAPAAPKTTTGPVSTYQPPANVGVLSLTCTWDGTHVIGHASWSGYPGIVISMTVPGHSYTTPGPAIGSTLHGTNGVHGACTASGAGQSKSGSV